jgi:hypothetical protein
MMRAEELVRRCVDAAENYKTLYIMGCFGAPMNAANKKRYTQNHSFNKAAARVKLINAATADTFGFDCVNLIKGILWGWTGDTSKTYGGAAYASNGVADVSADGMIKLCKGVTSDFSGIVPGAAVWMSGHIGVYIGDGLAVECTPKWENKVQITAVGNIGKKSGYNTRTWTKWGLIPYVDYSVKEEDDEMLTYEQWKGFMDQYRRELAGQPGPAYGVDELTRAVELGITDGSRPCDLATRQEVVSMIVRAKK